MEYAVVALITAVACGAIGVFVREWEIAAQRRQRHRLKNEVATLRLRVEYYRRLLEQHGIADALPDEPDKK